MHSKADAVLIRRCGKSNLHTESQLANDLAIFGANCVAKRGRGGGGGEDTSAMPNRRQKAPKSSSATAQLITEANREHLRVVASSTAKPTEWEGGGGGVAGVVKERSVLCLLRHLAASTAGGSTWHGNLIAQPNRARPCAAPRQVAFACKWLVSFLRGRKVSQKKKKKKPEMKTQKEKGKRKRNESVSVRLHFMCSRMGISGKICCQNIHVMHAELRREYTQ